MKPKGNTQQPHVPHNPDAPNKLKRSSTSGTERLSKDHALSKWRPRRVGIFFAHDHESTDSCNNKSNYTHDEPIWTCLILVEPVKLFVPHQTIHQHFVPTMDEELLFCYRKIITQDTPSSKQPETLPNARCQQGPAWYTIEENNLQVTVRYVMDMLERFVHQNTDPLNLRTKYAKFFTALGNDIFWSWEEFATQVVQFSAVS